MRLCQNNCRKSIDCYAVVCSRLRCKTCGLSAAAAGRFGQLLHPESQNAPIHCSELRNSCESKSSRNCDCAACGILVRSVGAGRNHFALAAHDYQRGANILVLFGRGTELFKHPGGLIRQTAGKQQLGVVYTFAQALLNGLAGEAGAQRCYDEVVEVVFGGGPVADAANLRQLRFRPAVFLRRIAAGHQVEQFQILARFNARKPAGKQFEIAFFGL